MSVSIYLTPNKLSISIHTCGLLVVTIMGTKRSWTIISGPVVAGVAPLSTGSLIDKARLNVISLTRRAPQMVLFTYSPHM